jgi:Helix-turn-helix domain
MSDTPAHSVPSIGRPRTIGETCEYFQVDRATIFRWREAGLLACTKAGRIVRFTDEQIADFQNRQSTAVTPPPPAPKFNPKYQHLGRAAR